MRKPIKILLIFIVILAIGIGGYFGYQVFIQSFENEANKDLKAGVKDIDTSKAKGEPEELYFGFTKEDYARSINNNVSSHFNVEPSQIYKAKKISKDYLDRLARYANQFLHLTTAETGKKLIKEWGFEPSSGHLVYVRAGNGIKTYLFFRKRDTGELKYFLNTPPPGSLIY